MTARTIYSPRKPAEDFSYLHGKTRLNVPITRRVVMRLNDLHDRMEADQQKNLTRGEVVSRLIELGAKAYEQRPAPATGRTRDLRYRDTGWLEAEYVGKQRSAPAIAQEVGCSRRTIDHWLERTGIGHRTRSAAMKLVAAAKSDALAELRKGATRK